MTSYKTCSIEYNGGTDETPIILDNFEVKNFSSLDTTFNEQVEFTNCTFLNLKIDRCNFLEDVKLENCSVEGKFSIQDSVFSDGVKLEYNIFKDGVYASNAKIEGDLNLSNAEIEGDLDLSKVQIKGNLGLEFTEIEGDLDLSNADIQGGVYASDAKIQGGVDASNAKINDFFFTEAKIQGGVDLSNAEIEGCLSFAKDKIQGGVDLSNAEIQGGVDLLGTAIEGDLDASNVKIQGYLSFLRAEIQGGVDLSNAEIPGRIDLLDITIEGGVDLSNADIQGDLNLSNAEIQGDVKLDGSTFEKLVIGQSAGQVFANAISDAVIGKKDHFEATIGEVKFNTSDLSTLKNIKIYNEDETTYLRDLVYDNIAKKLASSFLKGDGLLLHSDGKTIDTKDIESLRNLPDGLRDKTLDLINKDQCLKADSCEIATQRMTLLGLALANNFMKKAKGELGVDTLNSQQREAAMSAVPNFIASSVEQFDPIASSKWVSNLEKCDSNQAGLSDSDDDNKKARSV